MKEKPQTADSVEQGIKKPGTVLAATKKLSPAKKKAAAGKQSWWYAVATLAVAGALVTAALVLPDYLWPDKEASVEDDDPPEDFGPPVLNTSGPPGPTPAGMAWIPGGEFYMGVDPGGFPEDVRHFLHPEFYSDAKAVHKVYVDGFWMDKTEVTNEEFKKFVDATRYATIAEKPPDPKDYPGAPGHKIPKEPFSIVFTTPPPEAELRDHLEWWKQVTGACWKHPEGPGSDLKGREKHPAVHIAWDDAVAYCQWAKKRLPTEAEWEFAARGKLDRKFYCWGDELQPGGKPMCNYWQGGFPRENTKEDGFDRTAPVGSYPANGYGLFDMAGNVWEWCADYYQEKTYQRKGLTRNPKGPTSGFDPLEPGLPKRVQRGGSFLCADIYCLRYVPGARGKGEPKSAANHVGFRCVRDP